MSQVVSTYIEKREIVARSYANGGCPIKIDKKKCGETKGLEIIMDFHKLYQERINQIDVSAGGDSLQEKVDLQQDWINDLTEQNRMLAKVIQELEIEAIGRVQHLEEKLKNAAKSFGETDHRQDLDQKIEEPSITTSTATEEIKKKEDEIESLKQFPSEKEIKNEVLIKESSDQKLDKNKDFELFYSSSEDESTSINPLSIEPKSPCICLIPAEETIPIPSTSTKTQEDDVTSETLGNNNLKLKRSDKQMANLEKKSVLLLVDDKSTDEAVVLQPEKDLDQSSGLIMNPPNRESVTIMGAKDSLELISNKTLSSHIKSSKQCGCMDTETNSGEIFDDEPGVKNLEKEILKLKKELEERINKIIELNEENRALNELIKKLQNEKENLVHCTCLHVDENDTADQSTLIDVYKRNDDEFPASSSSTVCKEDYPLRARGGDDDVGQYDENCNASCQTDQCSPGCNNPECLNPNCYGAELVTNEEEYQTYVCEDRTCRNKDYFPPGMPYYQQVQVVAQMSVETHQQYEPDGNVEEEIVVDTTPSDIEKSVQAEFVDAQESQDVNDDFPITCVDNTCTADDCMEKGGNFEGSEAAPIQQYENPKGAGSLCSCRVPNSCQDEENPPPVTPLPIAPPPIPTIPTPSYGDNSCARGICETCACMVFPDPRNYKAKVPVIQSANQQPQIFQKEGLCLNCRGNLDTPLTEDKESHAVPPVIDATTSPPVNPEVYGFVCNKPCLCIEKSQPTPTVPIPIVPSIHEEKQPTTIAPDITSIYLCPDEICNQRCVCKVVPSETSVPDEAPIQQSIVGSVLSEPPSQFSQKQSVTISETPPVVINIPSNDIPPSPPPTPQKHQPCVGPCVDCTCQSRYPTKIETDETESKVTVEEIELFEEKPEIKEEPEEESETIKEEPVIDDVQSKITEKESKTTDAGDGNVIIRCVCKSKYCKIVPDPENPNQKLCVDVSDTDVEDRKDETLSCICNPKCPHTCDSSVNNDDQEHDGTSTVPVSCGGGGSCLNGPLPIYTIAPISTSINQNKFFTSSNEIGFLSTNSKLSKEKEYAGLSRKEIESLNKNQKKWKSLEKIKNLANNDDNLENADLKLIIANLKSKLLDAEDKIEELKLGVNYTGKDKSLALITKYSEEIKVLKKLLHWTNKEKEEYEYLKQKVKSLEQGKGDTESISTNLQTADEKNTIKTQLKKLTKKNKCYEEVVQFFKNEMSVMSEELLTLQEVLNIKNLTCQEKNTKLINAILQLRRINDRLVTHVGAVEKQVLLENQINQINEARITELQEAIGTKNIDLNQHDEIINDMKRKLINVTKQNNDLRKTIKNLTDTVVEIQESIKTVEKEHQEEVAKVESKVCLATGNLEDIKLCMEQKNSKIINLENDLKNQEVSLILARKELDALNEKKYENKNVINTLQEQITASEKQNKQLAKNLNLLKKNLKDHTSFDKIRNYELSHYKSLVEEMKNNIIQLNSGLEKCEATNIHFYDELENSIEINNMVPTKENYFANVLMDMKRSMDDMKKKLSEADYRGDLVEEEMFKLKESRMSLIQEETTTDDQKQHDVEIDQENTIISSIDKRTKLNRIIEEQKIEIEHLKKELEKEKSRKITTDDDDGERIIEQLKSELNESIERQKTLNEENDKIHNHMINLRKDLTSMENSYELLNKEHEDNKIQLKKTLRDKEYLLTKNQDLLKNMEQMRISHDLMEKQCRSMKKRLTDERSWAIKSPIQHPFNQRMNRRSLSSNQSPTRMKKLERRPSTDSTRYRSSSWYMDSEIEKDFNSINSYRHKNNNKTRKMSYDSNSSPFSSRSPSPRSHSFNGIEEEVDDDVNLNDWFAPNYKETDTDLDDEHSFVNKLQIMTDQVQEANKKWLEKMKKNHNSRSRNK